MNTNKSINSAPNIRQQNDRKIDLGETTSLGGTASSSVIKEHIPADSNSAPKGCGKKVIREYLKDGFCGQDNLLYCPDCKKLNEQGSKA